MALVNPTALDSAFTAATAATAVTSGSFTPTASELLLVVAALTDDAATIGTITFSGTHTYASGESWTSIQIELNGATGHRERWGLGWIHTGTSPGSGTVTATVGATIDRLHIRPLEITSNTGGNWASVSANTATKSGTGNFIAGEAGGITLSAPATTSYQIWGAASWNEAGSISSAVPATPTEMFEMAGGQTNVDRHNAAVYYITGVTATSYEVGSLNISNAANVGGGVEVIEESAAGPAPVAVFNRMF